MDCWRRQQADLERGERDDGTNTLEDMNRDVVTLVVAIF